LLTLKSIKAKQLKNGIKIAPILNIFLLYLVVLEYNASKDNFPLLFLEKIPNLEIAIGVY